MTVTNKTLLIGALVGAFALTSCGTSDTGAATDMASETNVGSDAATAAAAKHSLDLSESTVNWAGSMIGVKTHTGMLKFTDGELLLAGDQLQGGSFTVDMTDYEMTDDNYEADGASAGTRAHLMGHLMSDDFFAAEAHPTSKFEITRVEGNTAYGNLTVRGQTFEETVKNIQVARQGNRVKATGELTFDRQKYGVAWTSPMKDMVLSNDIKLKVELVANEA